MYELSNSGERDLCQRPSRSTDSQTEANEAERGGGSKIPEIFGRPARSKNLRDFKASSLVERPSKLGNYRAARGAFVLRGRAPIASKR